MTKPAIPKDPPGIRKSEWAIGTASLAIAAAGILLPLPLAGTVVLLAIGGAALCAFAALDALRTKTLGKIILMSGVFVFFWGDALGMSRGDPGFLIPFGIPGAGSPFPSEVVRLALFEVALLQWGLLVGYRLAPKMRRLSAFVATRVDARAGWRPWLRIALAVAGIGAIVLTYLRDPAGLWLSLTAGRQSTGAQGAFRYLYDLGLFGACLAAADAILVRDDRLRWRVARVGIALLAILPFVLRGTRHHFVFIAVAIGLCLLVALPAGLSRRRVALLAGVGALLVMVLQVQNVVRDYGWDDLQLITAERLLAVFSVGQFSAALFAIQIVPSLHPYFHEPATPFFLTHWVPHVLWPAKTEMASWVYYNQAYLSGGAGATNVTPSVVGQFHINWGPVGPLFISIWLGVLAVSADRLVLALDRRRHVAVLAVLAMVYAFVFSAFRFYSPVYATYVLLGCLALVLLTVRENAPGRRPA